MTHYISVCADNQSKTAMKVEMGEAFSCLCRSKFASDSKDGSMLIFNGYNDQKVEYPRRECDLNKFSTIFIDCDNESCDQNIIRKWKSTMKDFDYVFYETYSSTPVRPKFRAIIPVDAEMEWSKYAKKAIFQTFRGFADEKASWFYAPTRNRLDTIYENKVGQVFPSSVLKDKIDGFIRQEQLELTQRVLRQARFTSSASECRKEFTRKDFRELPLVIEYLCASKGNRNNSAYRAACSMFARGYEDYEIKSMLSQGSLPKGEIGAVFRSASRCRK